MKQTNAWLDIVRSTAILFVLLSHSRTFLVGSYPGAEFLKFGGFMGVELFFVLSGLLIGGILHSLSEHFSIDRVRIFFIRRWLRTLPNYYLFLLIAMAFSLTEVRPDDLSNVWKYLFFIQNLSQPHPAFFGEAWSLSIEEVFYLAFPLASAFLLILFRVSPKRSMVVLGVLTIAFCTAGRFHAAQLPAIDWDSDIRKIVLLRLDAIMLGVLTAFLLANGNRLIRSRLLAVALSLLFLFALVYSAITPAAGLNSSFFAKTMLFNLATLGCLGFVLLGYSLQIGAGPRRVASFLARISYSAYLCNLSLVFIFHRFLPVPAVFQWILFFPAVIAVSYAAYRFWESRFLAYRDRRFRDTPLGSGTAPRIRAAANPG